MLADKTPRLALITRALLDAATRGDWRLLSVTDRELSLLSAELAKRQSLSPSEQAALRQVQWAHAQAMASCEDEMQRLDTAMGALIQNREGLIAYDLVNDKEEAKKS